MEHPYEANVLAKSARGIVRGELIESGVVIATYRFNRQNWPQLAIKFGSSQAEARFDAFCDSLSRSETIEAIGGL